MRKLYELPEKIRVGSTTQPNGNWTKWEDGMERPVLLPMNSPEVLKLMLDRVSKPKRRKKTVIVDLVSKLRKAK